MLNIKQDVNLNMFFQAHFIDKLPDLTQISETVLHINLSFNDFMVSYMEQFSFSGLK